ncbi:hypothetical protein CEXT_7121 [Caerostris extrusa]|uniref:Uncharacterized protein n=1 Tax=Caerostris extrusa TaxID=172846 RepID=A0AAV4MW07_CAEEX|nr:hypothetical protein CEXT_7121 [Caerostris extrusa]
MSILIPSVGHGGEGKGLPVQTDKGCFYWDKAAERRISLHSRINAGCISIECSRESIFGLQIKRGLKSAKPRLNNPVDGETRIGTPLNIPWLQKYKYEAAEDKNFQRRSSINAFMWQEMGLCRRQTPCEPKQLGTEQMHSWLSLGVHKRYDSQSGGEVGGAGLLCPEMVGFDMCLAGELKCFSRSFQELAPDPRKGRQQTCNNFGQTVATICQSCLP